MFSIVKGIVGTTLNLQQAAGNMMIGILNMEEPVGLIIAAEGLNDGEYIIGIEIEIPETFVGCRCVVQHQDGFPAFPGYILNIRRNFVNGVCAIPQLSLAWFGPLPEQQVIAAHYQCFLLGENQDVPEMLRISKRKLFRIQIVNHPVIAGDHLPVIE